MQKIFELTLLLAALSVVACGGSDPELISSAGGAGARTDADGARTGVLYLESAEAGPLSAEAGTSKSVRVVLRHSGTHNLVDAQAITFSVVQAADQQTTLSASSAVTDEMGVAAVDLRLGPMAGSVTVRAEHPQAAPLDLSLGVTEATAGTIRVDIQNPGNAPVQLSPYRVSWFDSATFRCAAAKPRTRLPEAILSATAPTSDPVVQQGFPADKKYTVVVEALGNGGIALAQGCQEDVTVFAGTTTTTLVQLSMVPIQPSGTFVTTGTWDFSEALASQNDATGMVINVIEFMANPGDAIYNAVIDEVEDAVGISIDLLLDIAGIKERIVDYINQQIFRFANLETFVAISADLSTMLNSLEVESELTIDKTDADFGFTGQEHWKKVTVHWTWKCEQRQSADCGVHVIDVERDGLGAVSYAWTGRVDGYDQLVIDSHEAQVDTGALLLFLLENVILPDVTGGNAHSIEEALSYWIDCTTLAQRATQGRQLCDPTGFFCVGANAVDFACEAAVGELAEYIASPIADGSNTVDIQLSGTARLVDAASNGVADEIADGRTNGILNGTGEPVTVGWTAARP